MKNEKQIDGIICLSKWLEDVGIATVTAWRWRKAGWLKTINIAGRQYITHDAIAEFRRRAEAGEFEKEHAAPARK